jgi:threonine dehydratase
VSAQPGLSLADIRAAAARIRPHVHRTPVLTSSALDGMAGARLFLKCENFQSSGAFKARGAHNAVFALAGDVSAGVATHSSGNHGAALALAARSRGIPAHVVTPRTVSAAKLANMTRYGAHITLCEPTHAARAEAAARIVAGTGARLVHPFDDYAVMAGQGTAALELLEDVPDLDAVVCPVGGGGLLSGTAVAARGLKPGIRIFGAEPAGADDAQRSLRSGVLTSIAHPRSIADGLLAGSLAASTFALIRTHVDDIAAVEEGEIIAAMRRVWEILKIVIEPSSAVPVAALLEGRLPVAGLRVGAIITGGNVDLDRLPWQDSGVSS